MGKYARKIAKKNSKLRKNDVSKYIMSEDEAITYWKVVDESKITHRVSVDNIRSLIKILRSYYATHHFSVNTLLDEQEAIFPDIPFPDVTFVTGSKHIICRVTTVAELSEIRKFLSNEVPLYKDYLSNEFEIGVIVAYITLTVLQDNAETLELLLPIRLMSESKELFPNEQMSVRSGSGEYLKKIPKSVITGVAVIMADTMAIWHVLVSAAANHPDFLNKIINQMNVDTETGIKSFHINSEMFRDLLPDSNSKESTNDDAHEFEQSKDKNVDTISDNIEEILIDDTINKPISMDTADSNNKSTIIDDNNFVNINEANSNVVEQVTNTTHDDIIQTNTSSIKTRGKKSVKQKSVNNNQTVKSAKPTTKSSTSKFTVKSSESSSKLQGTDTDDSKAFNNHQSSVQHISRTSTYYNDFMQILDQI